MASMQLDSLGLARLDDAHEQLERHWQACVDSGGAPELFADLLEATRQHFADEEALMGEIQFNGLGEHQGEHRRLLNEMERMGRAPRMLRNTWLRDGLPEAMRLHVLRLDAQLSARLADESGIH